jgi:hypothetical protein
LALESVGGISLEGDGIIALESIARMVLESYLQNLFKVLVKMIEFSRSAAFNDGCKLLLLISCSLDTVDSDSSPFKNPSCMVDKLRDRITTGPMFRDRFILPSHLSKAAIEISADVLLGTVVDIVSRQKFHAFDVSAFKGFGYVTLRSTGDNKLELTRKRWPLQEGI